MNPWVVAYGIGAISSFFFLIYISVRYGPPSTADDLGWAIGLSIVFTVLWPIAAIVWIVGTYVEWRDRNEVD